MDYIKIDPRIFDQPEFMSVNWYTRHIYLGLLFVSAKHDLRGQFVGPYAKNEWLIRESYLESEEAGQFSLALDHLIQCGLLVPSTLGFSVASWEKWYAPKDPTNAERQSRYREKGKVARKLLATAMAQNVNADPISNGTQPNPTQLNPTQLPPYPPEGGAVDDGFDGEKLALLWNKVRPPECAEVLQVAGKREILADARAKEEPLLPGMSKTDFWTHVITLLKSMPFYLGKGDRGWKVDFDYIVKPGNAAKILEASARESKKPGQTRQLEPGRDPYDD
jgi:hypothetical protein